jgi:hypothetical protein
MKYYGKEKCRILKQIRAEIARQNDIAWVVSECSHKGDCRGTCPKCEQEVRRLEVALARREALGKTIAVAGISAGLALTVAGCANPFATQGHMEKGNLPENEQATEAESQAESLTVETLMGDIPIPGGETEPIDGEMPEMGAPIETDDSLMGDVTEWEEDPTTEPPIPGEEPETEEILMGDPVPPEWFTEDEQ